MERSSTAERGNFSEQAEGKRKEKHETDLGFFPLSGSLPD